MEKDNWAFNFDLFQGKLLEEGFINPLEAYHDLGNALAPYEFEKRQQSSYFSINDYNESDIYTIIKRVTNALPWTKRCVNHFTATAESAVLDLNPYFYEEQTKQDFINFENERGVTHLVCSNKTTSLVYDIIRV